MNVLASLLQLEQERPEQERPEPEGGLPMTMMRRIVSEDLHLSCGDVKELEEPRIHLE